VAPATPRVRLAVVAAAFVVSRAVLVALGVRYDISLMPWYWELLDVRLLQHHLAQSLWYLHSQPPGFNLLVGLALKLFPHHVAGAFHVLFLVLGLASALALEVVLERLGFRPWLSVALAVLISCAPFWLVYENWLYNEYIVMTLLLLAAFALTQFTRAWRVRWGVAFFAILAAIVYTRSSFQIVWMALVVACLCAINRDTWRIILKAAAVPLLVVVLLYAKNAVMFGSATTSSWIGMDLARITLWVAPESEKQRLVGEGKLSRVALVDPFSPLPDYKGLVRPPGRTGIPVLDRAAKSNGAVNLDNREYLELSRIYLRQVLRFIRYDPEGYARGIGKAAGKLSVPATDYSYVYPQRDRIRIWDQIFNGIVYWRTPWLHRIGFGLVLMYVVTTLWGLVLFVRLARRGKASAAAATTIFVWATCVYLLLVGSLTDFGENERIHVPIDPLVLVLAALVVRDVVRTLRRRRALRNV
jgi:hypothetical protein